MAPTALERRKSLPAFLFAPAPRVAVDLRNTNDILIALAAVAVIVFCLTVSGLGAVF